MHLPRAHMLLLLGTFTGLWFGCGASSANTAQDQPKHVFRPTATSIGPPPTTGKLNDYLKHTLKQHPGLTAQYAKWQQRQSNAHALDRWKDPILTYTFAPIPIETRLGPQRHSVRINQTIPWIGQLNQNIIAESTFAQAELARFDALFLAIQYDVHRHYWALWRLRQQQRVLTQQLTLLNTLATTLKASVQTGKHPAVALSQVNIIRVELRDQLAALKNQHSIRKVNLAVAMGLDQKEPIINALDISTPPPKPQRLPSPNALIDASKKHPSLLALQKVMRARHQRRQATALKQRPKFMLGAQWSQISDNGLSPDAGRDAMMVSVGISIPLWTNAQRAALDVEDAKILQAKSNLRLATQQHCGMIRTTHMAVIETQRRLNLLNTTLMTQAQTTYDMSLGAYATQKTDVATVIMAIKKIFSLQNEHIALKTKHAQLLAKLEMLVGQPMNTLNVGVKP